MKVLDLHHLKFNNSQEIESVVQHKLDSFLRPYLQCQNSNHKLEIIVGRGLSSNNWIEGKNPMRHYTEKYLKMLGFKFQNINQNGSVIVWV